MNQNNFLLNPMINTVRISIFVLIFVCIGCEKRKPKYTQVQGENYNSESLSAANLKEQYLAFIFMSPECPLSENYTKTIKDLSARYKGNDIGFYIVFPGKFYPRPQIEVFVEKYRIPKEMVIYDPDNLFKTYFDATITPEVFLVDITGNILYQGAIDNWAITLGKQRQVITEHYLANAINSSIKNVKVKPYKTRAVGCIIE